MGNKDNQYNKYIDIENDYVVQHVIHDYKLHG